eukprot:328678-Prymnesium_polylepis.3
MSLPVIPAALLSRPRRPLAAFDGTWVAADWHDHTPPRTHSGFFLPLIFSGLGAADGPVPAAPAKHFGGRRAASAPEVAAAQPLWAAVFSHWPLWVRAIRGAADRGELARFLARGVTGKASSLLPLRCPGIDQWSLSALPHIQPQAQGDIIEAALGIEEATRFYASVMALFEKA